MECLLKSEPHHDSANTQPPILLQNEQNFISFLSDIPKLPKYQADSNTGPIKNHKRPPPSKGLATAKKYNENILLVPHELSTIVEADSQLSTKMGNGLPSPATSKSSLCASPITDIEKSSSNILSKMRETKLADKSPTSKIFSHSFEYKTDSSIVSIQNETTIGDCNKTPYTSGDTLKQFSSSCGDIETIEAMLKNIGMEWAIPTLHKTKEALALSSSSSSSFDVPYKHTFGKNRNVCAISLKSSLPKQLFYEISTSNSRSNDSPVSFLEDLSNISALQANSKEQQRTSTPLTTSKSNDGDVFSIETDISSVKYTANHS